MSAGLTATALEEAPLANFGSFFDMAAAGEWDQNTGNTLAEIGLTLADTGVDNNASATFFEQTQAYVQATARRDSQEQARILQQIAQGFSRYYGRTRPSLSARPLGTRRFATLQTIWELHLSRPAASSRTALVKLGPSGHLYLGKKVRARFLQYANEVVLVRMLGDVILGVDFLRDGPPDSARPRTEFTLVYQNGNLVDSVYRLISGARRASWKQATVKTYLGNSGELSHFGHFRKIHFEKHKNAPVEVETRDGIVVEVRILKSAARLQLASETVPNGVKEFSLFFDEEGNLKDSSTILMPEKLKNFTGTLVTRLSKNHGVSSLGNTRSRTRFDKHAGEVVAVRFQNGHITQILFTNAARIKDVDVAGLSRHPSLVRDTRDYSRIYDEKGILTGSFNNKLDEEKFSRLKAHVIITNLSKEGELRIGTTRRAYLTRYPRHVIALHVQDGVITKVVLLRTRRISEVKWPLKNPEDVTQEIPFQLVWDTEGRLTDSFYSPHRIPSRFQQHLGKMTGDFRVDVFNGFLHGRAHYYFGDNADYRGWPVSEIVFGDASRLGEITEFVIKNAKTGETIRLDARKYRQNLALAGAMAEAPQLSPTPEDEVLRIEQIVAVQKALGQFDESARGLLLRAADLYREKTTDEIAAELGVPSAWIIWSFKKLRESLRN